MAIASPKTKEELVRQFKFNPEVNNRLEAFMKADPGLVQFVKELPREQLERKFLLRKMQDQQRKQGYDAKVKAWLEKPEQAELVQSLKATISPDMKPEKQAQMLVNQVKNYIRHCADLLWYWDDADSRKEPHRIRRAAEDRIRAANPTEPSDSAHGARQRPSPGRRERPNAFRPVPHGRRVRPASCSVRGSSIRSHPACAWTSRGAIVGQFASRVIGNLGNGTVSFGPADRADREMKDRHIMSKAFGRLGKKNGCPASGSEPSPTTAETHEHRGETPVMRKVASYLD
jgi:hypothetical protein